MAPLSPRLPDGPVHSELWKIGTGLLGMATWKGHLMNVSNKFSISFRLNETHKIQACVRLPFLFMLCMPHWDPDNNLLTCHNCSFYTCLDSISFNQEKPSLYILNACNGVWMPVIMESVLATLP